MTNSAMDELRRRAEASRPGYTSDDDRQFIMDNAASAFHFWRKFTGTIAGLDYDPSGKNGTLVMKFRNISGEENPKHFDDRIGEEHRMFFDDPSRSTQREWSEQMLTNEALQEASGDKNLIVVNLPVGTVLSAELDFVPTGTTKVGKNGKSYPQRTWYYRITSVRTTPAPAAQPDPANVAALAVALVGESADISAGDTLKKMQTLGIKDAALQSLVVSGKFVAHAESQSLLASAEGVLYDPTANSI